MQAAYLQNRERVPVRPSIRLAVNRLLDDADISSAFEVIENVSKSLL